MKHGSKRGAIIAVDGPSGVGKTTVSRLIAGRLKLKYINTGAMYRSLALAADEAGVDLNSEKELLDFCSNAKAEFSEDSGGIILNGKDYTGGIRTQRAGDLASVVSTKKPVRDFLVNFQRGLGKDGSIVMEGRDIGTVVFPDADVKIFLDAPHEIRARRRHLELAAKTGLKQGDVSLELKERDRRDTERANSPLKIADDAVYVDTGGLEAQEVADRILKILKDRGVATAR